MNYETLEVLTNDEGDLVLQFSDDMIENLGWNKGDELVWTVEDNGSVILSKKEKEETELVLVETISMFRMRYVVEVPKGKKEYASDTVVMQEAKEFSQVHLDEIITSSRVITEDEMVKICDEDNAYLRSWTREQKLNFITRNNNGKINKDETP